MTKKGRRDRETTESAAKRLPTDFLPFDAVAGDSASQFATARSIVSSSTAAATTTTTLAPTAEIRGTVPAATGATDAVSSAEADGEGGRGPTTWPQFIYQVSPKELWERVTPLILPWAIWFVLVSWLLIQDNGSRVLDSPRGLGIFAAKALLVLAVCLAFAIVLQIHERLESTSKKREIAIKAMAGILALGLAFVLSCLSCPRSEPLNSPTTQQDLKNQDTTLP